MRNNKIIFAMIIGFFLISSIIAQPIKTIEYENVKLESNSVEQDSKGCVILDLKNYFADKASIKSLGVHLEWQVPDEYYQSDEIQKGGVIDIALNETKTFKIYFTVPSNARIGIHQYTLSCYFEFDNSGKGWTNKTYSNLEIKQHTSGGQSWEQTISGAVTLTALLAFILLFLVITLIAINIILLKRVRRLDKTVNELSSQKGVSYAQTPTIHQPVYYSQPVSQPWTDTAQSNLQSSAITQPPNPPIVAPIPIPQQPVQSGMVVLPSKPNESRTYMERDNRGTRHDNIEIASTYWYARASSSKKDPFVLYSFDTEKDALEAFLELPCIHIAEDSKKLICTEVLIFGYYLAENGKYEAILCGDDITHGLWEQAKMSFTKHGGKRKNDLEPIKKEKVQSSIKESQPEKVVFIKEDRVQRDLVTMTYRIYKGPNADSAKAFLEQNPVDHQYHYIIVETPEGNYGRDIQGIYKE